MTHFGFPSPTRFAFAAIAGLATLVAGQSAHAATFASFSDLTNDFSYTIINGGTTAQLAATAVVTFQFNNISDPGLPAGNQTANFTFTQTTTSLASQDPFGTDQQQFLTTGNFSFTEVGGPFAGKNLLTGVFSRSLFQGTDGSGTAGLASSTTGFGAATITYTSDFLSFANTVTRGLSLAFSSITNVGGSAGPTLPGGTPGFLTPFTAAATGSFSSTPLPIVNPTVPEPASFAMLGLGLAGVGACTAVRRRNKKSA